MDIPGFGTAFALQVRRDLQLAFRNVGQLANPLMFFVMVTTLFPLALDPGPQKLSMIAPAVVWVAALLASLLAGVVPARRLLGTQPMEILREE